MISVNLPACHRARCAVVDTERGDARAKGGVVAPALLRHNLLVYGKGGLIPLFPCIKVIKFTVVARV